MAYMSQDQKKKIVAMAKPILKKYGIKATFAVDNHSTLVCNIRSGKIDFITNFNEKISNTKCHSKGHIAVSRYRFDNEFSGDAKAFLGELISVMNMGNHDNSDLQTDYFDVGWYIDVNIGKWNKPYILEK
jgi:hypothetical protein